MQYVNVHILDLKMSDTNLLKSVDLLCSHKLLTYDEVVDICLADDKTKIELLDNKLAALSPSM